MQADDAVSYKPLAEVRKDLRVEWYRCPIDGKVLRELSRRSDLQGWFQTGGHLALFVASGSLTYFFWSQQIWLGFAVGLFLHGTIGSFFVGVASHELLHGSVFRTKFLNKFFLYFFSLLSWWDTVDYATSHTYHHRYTLHPEGDREVLLPIHPSVGKTFLLQMFTVNLLTQRGRSFTKGGLISTIVLTVKAAFGRVGPTDQDGNEWLQTLHEAHPEQHRKEILFARCHLAFHGTVLVVAIATGQWVLPLLLSFFPFIANWAQYSCGMTQHCGLRDKTTDFRKSVRSTTLIPILEFLYWRMNWHIEHHMYAGVPCYNLKKLHNAVAHDMPSPRTLISSWREMLSVWRRQQVEPDYQFDTPLPATAGHRRGDSPDEVESSMGDLELNKLR